jgi:putative membrane protein
MRPILSKKERESLASLVAEVEKRTAGELVTVVLRKTESYAAFRIGWSAALAFVAAGVVHLAWPSWPAQEVLGAQALFALACVGILGWPPLLRIFVPHWAKQRAVEQRAKQLFLDQGVTETRDRSGVLIFLSEFERRVVVLGDRGIHEHLGNATWETLVADLVFAIRSGKPAEGLQRIITRLGQELSAKFPPRADDTDELPNAVITDIPETNRRF